MSEELGLGQREISLEESFELSVEEKELVCKTAKDLMVEILKVSGKQTLNALLGELVQNAGKGLDLSAKPMDVEAGGTLEDLEKTSPAPESV